MIRLSPSRLSLLASNSILTSPPVEDPAGRRLAENNHFRFEGADDNPHERQRLDEAEKQGNEKTRVVKSDLKLATRKRRGSPGGSEQQWLKGREQDPSGPRLLSKKKKDKNRQHHLGGIMANKVLAAYVVADLLFAATGAFLVGFSVIVQNFMFEVPTEGVQAIRNLLYQQFPLTGMMISPGSYWGRLDAAARHGAKIVADRLE